MSLKILVLLTLVYLAAAQTDDVLDLKTKEDVDKALEEHSKLLVIDFYTNDCGGCKLLAPKYAEAARILKQKNPEIVLAKFNCSDDKKVCKKFKVIWVPDVVAFRRSEVQGRYHDDFDTMDILNWVLSQWKDTSLDLEKAPAQTDDVLDLKTKEDVDKALKEHNKLLVIDFYENDCGGCKLLAPKYAKVASILKQIIPEIVLAKFNCSDDKKLCRKFDVEYVPNVMAFRQGEFRGRYHGDLDTMEILNWVLRQWQDTSLDLEKAAAQTDDVLELKTKEDVDKALEEHGKLLVIDFYEPWCHACNTLAPKYAEVATILKKTHPEIVLAKFICDNDMSVCQRYNMKYVPTVFAFKQGKTTGKFKGPLTTEAVLKWVLEQWNEGRAQYLNKHFNLPLLMKK